MCVICNLHVKSDILWSTHLQSKKHKETVVALKNDTKPPPSTQPSKSEPSCQAAKPVQPSLQPTLRVNKEPLVVEDDVTAIATLKRISSEPTEDSSIAKKQKVGNGHPSSATIESTLPSDFFDPKALKNESDEADDDEDKVIEGIVADEEPSKEKNKKMQETSKSGTLPEGFFDDPKTDAKARNVEYKDPMTEEWERFQKSIAKETDQSEALVQAADEETHEDKELAEVNEQVACFKKAEELRLKQEEWLTKRAASHSAMTSGDPDVKKEDGDVDSGDDVDIEEIMNWRSKDAYKY